MFVQRVRSEGISQLSYFIGQGNEAAVIDPRRDIDIYLQLARDREMNIRFVFETHRNEDFVVGSQELASAAGSKVFHGGQLFFNYGNEVKDGQEIHVGKMTIRAIHTPGHTPESFSYVLYDPSAGQNAVMVFCGDALLVGETGRTDFYGPLERERLASDLYNSITQKLLPLGPGTIVCPAHGAGSVCATEIQDREDTTIGIEMSSNPMLKMSRAEFIEMKKKENLEMSPTFKRMELINLEGARVLGHMPVLSPLLPKEMKHAIVKGAFVLDVRSPEAFAGGHIQGSINLHNVFIPVYAGYVIPFDRPIAIVAEDVTEAETTVRYLVRQGFDDYDGYLRHGIDDWSKNGNVVGSMGMIGAKELFERIKNKEEIVLLDVRDRRETVHGMINGAKLIHLAEVHARMQEIPRNKTVVTYCGSGFRGSCAASILLRSGYSKILNLHGGFNAWRSLDLPVSR